MLSPAFAPDVSGEALLSNPFPFLEIPIYVTGDYGFPQFEYSEATLRLSGHFRKQHSLSQSLWRRCSGTAFIGPTVHFTRVSHAIEPMILIRRVNRYSCSRVSIIRIR
jgi:hypothetical protein